jgi:thiamine-phosphate pyrophosphorylase
VKPALERPLSCLITRGDATPDNFVSDKTRILDTVRRAADASVSMVQIREKSLTARQLFELVSEAVAATAGTRTLILVNERFDIAVAAGAAGVHLRADSLGASAIRAAGLSGIIVGVSAHSIEDVREARDGGADYATLAPVFDSPGKSAPLGVEQLRFVCEAVRPFPVIALGGIDETNARVVLKAGAAGFASIRFLNSAAGVQLPKEISDDQNN